MSGFNTIGSNNNSNNNNNTGNNNNNNGLPPTRNPLATAFEGFMRETPFVTRSVLLSLFATWCFQLVAIDPSDALGNLPQYTIGHGQLYRIVTSPLLCQSIFNLLFAFLSFVDHGKRLEQSLGSIQFAWLFWTFAILSNLIHILVSYLLYYFLIQDDEILMQSCEGIWIVLFGMIALECTNTHLAVGGRRPLFIWTIPTIYYPIAICALWSLLGGGTTSRLPYFYSLGVGYAYAYGYFDRTRLSVTQCQQLEDASWLSQITSREGWITGHAATGSSAWSQPPTMGSSFLPLTRTNQQQQQQQTPQTQSSFPGTMFGRYGSSTTTTSSDGFPSGGGRTLGSTNTIASNATTTTTTTTSSNSGPTQRRSHATESTVKNGQALREARLKALEKQQELQAQEVFMEDSKETA